MSDKLQSEITGISLDEASFQGTGTAIAPTYINYFFGMNGTGKTTIAKALKSGVGITSAPGKSEKDFLLLVYDQEFITANMSRYHNLDGVFTINAKNVEVQKQLDEKNAELETAGRYLSDAAALLRSKKEKKDHLLRQLYKDCWKATANLRAAFAKTQTGKGRSMQFTEEVKRHAPVEHDVEELKRMYDSAFSDHARPYRPFSTVMDPSVLDTLPGNEILELAVVNTANTPFADFLRSVGSMEWVRRGHSEYQGMAGGKCPYCSGNLPVNFERIMAESFDAQYQSNLAKLNEFLTLYRKTANELFLPLQKLPNEIYPGIDVNSYREKLAAVRSVITANIDKIKNKIEEPSRIVTLDHVAPKLQELSEMITEFNRRIDSHNEIIVAGPKMKEECVKEVFDYFAFLLKDIIDSYYREDASLDAEIKELQVLMIRQERILAQLQADRSHLSRQTVETETAMNNINAMLRDSGLQGFELRPHRELPGSVSVSPQINYEVVRTDTGEVAENLSDGEKNLIAFLYFQQKVFGSDSPDGDPREKVVVIDDPVSGMDSSKLFLVSAQVRKMIEICRNNADGKNQMVPENFIKQIFILTHNAYFFREITYEYADRYDFVSFYLLQKRNNRSSVQLCDCQNPDCPTERLNVNPVKNSYSALWEEYREVPSGIPLMNIIRRILEYYFLQLCGYQGSDLRKCILEDHKYALTHDQAGNEDYTKFEIAASMLSYLSSDPSEFNKDRNYVEGCADIWQCRETFHMIFQYMNHEQHYNMMMGIR